MIVKERKWTERTTKEKLDTIFVIVGIVTFTLTAIINFKVLANSKK
jgi:hypothetical protein